MTQTLQLWPLCNIWYNYLPSISSTWDCLTNIIISRLTEEDVRSGVRTLLTAPDLSPLEIGSDNCFQKYALEMLGKLVAADEFWSKRRSQLQIFYHLDVGVFKSQNTGEFQYMVNEITPCHTTELFMAWDQSGRMEVFFQKMVKILHFLASECKRLFHTSLSSTASSGLPVWLFPYSYLILVYWLNCLFCHKDNYIYSKVDSFAFGWETYTLVREYKIYVKLITAVWL